MWLVGFEYTIRSGGHYRYQWTTQLVYAVDYEEAKRKIIYKFDSPKNFQNMTVQ